MADYKKILIGYINESKRGDGHYLSIKNVSDEPVTIEPDGKLFLSRTPDEILQKHPKVPHYSKSVKVETQPSEQQLNEDVPLEDIPF